MGQFFCFDRTGPTSPVQKWTPSISVWPPRGETAVPVDRGTTFSIFERPSRGTTLLMGTCDGAFPQFRCLLQSSTWSSSMSICLLNFSASRKISQRATWTLPGWLVRWFHHGDCLTVNGSTSTRSKDTPPSPTRSTDWPLGIFFWPRTTEVTKWGQRKREVQSECCVHPWEDVIRQ